MNDFQSRSNLEPLPSPDSLTEVLWKTLGGGGNSAHVKTGVTAFLDTLQKLPITENFSNVAEEVRKLTFLLSTGDWYSDDVGVRLVPVGYVDDHVAINALLCLASSCFSTVVEQVAFLCQLSQATDIARLALTAAARTELTHGNVQEAFLLSEKAKSYATSQSVGVGSYTFKLQHDIQKAADVAKIALDDNIWADDLSEYFCPFPFIMQVVLEYNFKMKTPIYTICTCPAFNYVKYALDESDPWNHKTLLKVRASILDGSFEYCSRKDCHLLRNKTLQKKSEIKDKYLLDVIKDNRVVLDKGPQEVRLHYDDSCDLKCPSCRTEFKHYSTEQIQELDAFAEKQILPLLKDTNRLLLSGFGEALSSPHSLRLLRQLSPQNNPNLSILIRSNGMNLQKKWDSVGAANQLIKRVIVSVDGAEKETFEKLRYPGKWVNLNQSMEWLCEMRRSGKIDWIQVQTVIQADNYMQLSKLFSLCISWNVDFCLMRSISNMTYQADVFEQEINICSTSHPKHEDFLREMTKLKAEYSELTKNKAELKKEGIKTPQLVLLY